MKLSSKNIKQVFKELRKKLDKLNSDDIPDMTFVIIKNKNGKWGFQLIGICEENKKI